MINLNKKIFQLDQLKKKSFLLIKIAIFILAYFFIFKKLKGIDINNYQFDDYNYKYLFLAFLLMFLNWILEAYKWILLVNNFQKLSLKNALKSVTIGIVFGLFTPNRLGEIPGKALLLEKNNRIDGTIAASLGSFAQFTITFLLGIIGISFILFFLKNVAIKNSFSDSIKILFYICGLLLLFIYFYSEKIVSFLIKLNLSSKLTSKLKILSDYSKEKLFYILILSLLRYFVFTFQFYLLLLFFNIDIPTITAFSSIFSIFLILNILPHFVIADLGIRGSISIFVFSQFITTTPEIIGAPILLWSINILLPAIVGQFFISKMKLQ